ncbi:MAG: 2-oxo acid dehydrogenase subunit E2 [Microcoleus sp. CSU_2_2]|nr:2-oxo acid dehydrogenase subunit E2 [Microcoleus sp. SU_5_3]NJS11799.1 2-oxo acid dehydrogenase subunit E2 [Microcoleus sp. CSU_2_2]
MKPLDLIGSFKESDFPSFRNPTIDTMVWGRQRHHIPILLEIDVTAAREGIHDHKTKTGQGISFTSWIVKCLAQAVSEHKYVHALRKGKRQLVTFDDVDVTIIIERVAEAGEKLPMPYIIRKANEKTVADIHAEIRAAQRLPVVTGEVQIGSHRTAWMTKIFTILPQFVRDRFFWQPVFRNPFLFKRMMGTISVTALGMVGQGGLSWGIPIGIHPLIIAVGEISKRPGILNEQIVIREYVGLTVLFDHDVTDGAPVARFIRRLQELMADGYGLESALGEDSQNSNKALVHE